MTRNIENRGEEGKEEEAPVGGVERKCCHSVIYQDAINEVVVFDDGSYGSWAFIDGSLNEPLANQSKHNLSRDSSL